MKLRKLLLFISSVSLTFVTITFAQDALDLGDNALLHSVKKQIEAMVIAGDKADTERQALEKIEASFDEAQVVAHTPLPTGPVELAGLEKLDQQALHNQVELREERLKAYRNRKEQFDRIPGLIDTRQKMISQAIEGIQQAAQKAVELNPLLTELARRISKGLISQNQAIFSDHDVDYWSESTGQRLVKYATWLESYNAQKKLPETPPSPEAAETLWNLETDHQLQHSLDVASIMLQAAKHEASEGEDLEKADQVALPTVITRIHSDWKRALLEYEKAWDSANIKRNTLAKLDAKRRDLSPPSKELIPIGEGHSELKKARRDAVFSDQLVRYDTDRLEMTRQANDVVHELIKELSAIPTAFEQARRQTVTLKSALKLADRWQREGKIESFDFPEGATVASLAKSMQSIAETEASRRREVTELSLRINNKKPIESARQALEEEQEKNKRFQISLQEELSYATFLKEMAVKDESALITLVKPQGTLNASIETMNETVERDQHEFDRAMQTLSIARDAIRSVENPYVRMGFRSAPARLNEIKSELDNLKDARLPEDRSSHPLLRVTTVATGVAIGVHADEDSERNQTLIEQTNSVKDALEADQDFASGLLQYFINLDEKIKRYTEALGATDKAFALADQVRSELVNEEKRKYACAREIQRRLDEGKIDRSQIPFDLSTALTRRAIAEVQSDRNERIQAFSIRRKSHQIELNRLQAIAVFGKWAKIRADFADRKATLISQLVQRIEAASRRFEDLAPVDRKQLEYDAKNLREAEDIGWEGMLASVSRVKKRKLFDESLDTFYLTIARIDRQLHDYAEASKAYLSLIELCNTERGLIVDAPEKMDEGLQLRMLSYQTARHLAAIAISTNAQLTIEDAFKQSFGSTLPVLNLNQDRDKDYWANRLFAAEARLWGHRRWTEDVRRRLSRLGLDAEIALYDQHQAKIGSKERGLTGLRENHYRSIAAIRSDYSKEIYGAALRTVVSLLLIPLLAWIVVGLVNRIASRIEERVVEGMARDRISYHERMKTLSSVTRKSVSVVVWIIAGLYLLHELGTPVSTILASAGVMGLAFAFGAQSLIRDFFHGFFILLENQYTMGDWIEVGDIGGTVERLTLRVTVLRDMEGTLHFIPNGAVASVSNMTHGWSQVKMEIGVGYDEDIERVSVVILEAANEVCQRSEWKDQVLSDPVVPGLQSFGDSSLNIRLVVKTQPGMQWGLARELRKRIKERFDEAGIEIPFPQRVIHHVHTGNSPNPQEDPNQERK